MVDFEPLDEALRALLDADTRPPGGSLLAQTLATGLVRRQLLSLLPLQPGWQVLDLGTGFGPVAFELARLAPLDVVGVDVDDALVDAACSLASRLPGFLAPGSSIRFEQGDVASLGLEPARFDLVTARLLFQHLADPLRAAGELARVLRPGGYAFVFDVDDGLSAAFPPADGPLAALEEAFVAWQAGYGGDRHIGRKLSSLLSGAGLSIERITVVPQAEHRRSEPGDPARAVTAARFRAAAPGIAAAGIVPGAELERLIAAYEASPALEQCRIECQVAVLARRPEASS